MRQRTFIVLAALGVAAGAACSSSSSNGTPDGGQQDASGSGSGSSSSGASSSGASSSGASSSSGSSGGTREAGLLMGMQIGTPPTSMAGGVYCPGQFGLMAACAAPAVCCWGDQSQVPTPLAGCTASSACTGSAISCSGPAGCSAGQVCCFGFATDAGVSAAGVGTSFTTQCATDCPTGDMVHYQLCGSSSDCPAGEVCNNMAPYAPYCFSAGGRDGGGGDDAADAGPE